MAGSRRPGSQCSHGNPEDIQDGTLCRAQSPPPTPLGTTVDHRRPAGGQYAFVEGGQCLIAAYNRAILLSPAAVYQETGYQLGSLLKGLIPGLLQMLLALGATTVAGAGIGTVAGFFAGGVGAAPGAVIGGELGLDVGMAILSWLGVAFLLESIGTGLGEMAAMLWIGIQRAWHAGERRGVQRDPEIERAAQEMAKAVGILVRLLLQGIVAYLLKNAAVASSRGAIGTFQAVRGAGTEAAANDVVSGLVRKLRTSKLGDEFASWVEQNWRDLLKNPRLRPKKQTTVGGFVEKELPPTRQWTTENKEFSKAADRPLTSRQALLRELAKDPAHGGRITPKSLQEAEAALSSRESGRIPGPIRRDPSGAADFIDARGTRWDVKGFNSNFPPDKGGFALSRDLGKVQNEIAGGENVIIDTTNMSPEDVRSLRSAIATNELEDGIVWYP